MSSSNKNVENELKIADIKEEQKIDTKGDGWGDEDWDDFDIGIEAKKNENAIHSTNKEVAQSKSDGWSDFDVNIEPKNNKNVDQKTITQSKNDGWDDFNVDTEPENIGSQSNTNTQVAPSKNDGWDDFDDWNDDKNIESEVRTI